MKSRFLCLLILSSLFPALGSAQSLTTEDFQYFQFILRSESGAELAIGRLKDEESGFQEHSLDKEWIKADEIGIIEVEIFGGASASVTFRPKNREPYGDAAFAELLRQSDGFNISQGNIMELIFEYSDHTLYLSFRMPDNAWVKTSVFSEWR